MRSICFAISLLIIVLPALQSSDGSDCPEGCVCTLPELPCQHCRHGYRHSTGRLSCVPCKEKCSLQQQEVPLQDSPLLSIPSVREGDSVTITERYFVGLDPSVDKDTVQYILARPTQLGSVLLAGKVLQIGDIITRSNVVEGKLSYRSDKEIGLLPAQDRLYWNVSASKRADGDDKLGKGRNVLVNGRVLDSSGKVLRRTEDTIKRARDEIGASGTGPQPRVSLPAETLMIAIEPRDNQPPQAAVNTELLVDEGATEILSPDILYVNDNDTKQENLMVVIDNPPQHGYLEVRDQTGRQRKVLSEFPLSALLEERLSYVQSEHKGSEPRTDSFRFHVRDTSANRSPLLQLDIVIENVDDEPPQITTHPLLLSIGQDRVILTGDHFDIQDQDTEPSDIQITLVQEPTNGRLQQFDPLTNSDRTLQQGESFYYQELLDGNIAFISSAEEVQIRFRVNDGDSVSQEVTLRYINKQKDEELFGLSGSTPCVMEFNATELKVDESSGTAIISVVRTGDLSVTCSVICSTEPQSADDPKDFDSRSVAESSRVFFLRGVTVISCPVQLKNDDFYEGDEVFLARLSNPQVEQLNGQGTNGSALIGSRSQLAVRIQDDEDITRVQFNQTVFRSSIEADSATLHVERSGDLRFPSTVFFKNVDGSAKEGKDYVVKGRRLDFASGEKWNSFTVAFLTKNTWPKSFQIILNAEESVKAQIGPKSSATVFIPPTITSGPALLPAEPIVVSLMDYDRIDSKKQSVPAGYPVVCVTPCDPKYPLYNISTQKLCRSMAIDVSKIRFSWEISPPLTNSDPSNEGTFHRLNEPTAFSGIGDRVLDAVFFSRDFKIRCVAQPVRQDSLMIGPATKSRPVTVMAQSGLCPPFAPMIDDDQVIAGQQPFSASLSYVNNSDPIHPDTMRIQVVVPHSDGLIPILSTQPLHGIRHVMSDPAYRSHHKCSNLHPATGFLSEKDDGRRASLPFEFSKNIRQESAVRLYRHLDSTGCLWDFEAFFTMTELVQLCGGQVTSNFQTTNRGQVQVTVRVPLYVTLISAATGGLSWTSVEHQTEMEFSFSYASVLLGQRGVTESKLALAVQPHVSRVRTDPNNGRLVVEFQTETRFAGRYQDSGTQLHSPAHLPQLGFELEMMWSQIHPSGSTFQKWRAVSNYTLQDYTGNYTLVLVPCPIDQPKSGRKAKEDCQPTDPFNVTLPIHYQQPFRPEPVHYSLETTFQLTNDVRAFLRKPRSINDIKDAEFEGSFHNGERVYGRVLWHPSNELSPGYRLWIEKLYLCAGRDGYVPLFEPNAEQPQFGCLENSQRLKYRLLLLDREDPYGSDKAVQGLALDAKFASQVDQLRTGMAQLPSMDGFVFSVDPLFQLEPGIRWFLQVSYSVQPVGVAGRWKRQQGSGQPRRGTNMRFLPLDWPSTQNDSASEKTTSGESAVLASTLLLAAGLLVILVMAVLIVFSVYYRPEKNRKSEQKTEHEAENDADESTPMKTLNNNGRTPSGSIKTTLV